MSFQGCVTLVSVQDSTSTCASQDCVQELAKIVVEQFPKTLFLFHTRESLRAFALSQIDPNWRTELLYSSASIEDAAALCDRLCDVRELMEEEGSATVLGAVLERIVFEAMSRHYQSQHCQLERGFAVHIDGRPTSCQASEKSLDVGGWNNERNKGELYEVKSLCSKHPKHRLLSSSVADNIDYLQKLAILLDVHEGERIVALVSWQHTGRLKDDFDECRWSRVLLYGFSDLPQLRSGVIEFGDS